jgi:hypothetical protein
VNNDLTKGITPSKTVFDAKSFFKPLNMRLKNMQAVNKI